MSDLDDFKATYFEECTELLLDLEEQFAAIGEGDRSSHRLNAVFRAIHSIKGGGGAFGFSDLVGFAHAYETLLDHIRDGRVEMTGNIAHLCLRANDIVADLINAARSGVSLDAGYGLEEKAQFDALTAGDAQLDVQMEEFDLDFVPVMVRIAHADEEDARGAVFDLAPSADDSFAVPPMAPEEGRWEIRFTPHRELYARANDPLLLLRELAQLGEVEVRAVVDHVPTLTDFEPFGVYCSWEITLRSPSVTEAEIAEVFEFVDGICDLGITQVSGIAPPEAMAAPQPDLAIWDTDPEAEVVSLIDLAAAMKPAPRTASAELTPSLHQTATTAESHDGDNDRRNGVHSIRVDLDKIDRVVNMVGELVIAQSMLTQQMDETLRAQHQELVRGLEVLAQTTRGLQDSVMSIRAQPVKTVFNRMPRLVRELSARTGKRIRLETIGENTEIDKTIIEQLSDPLTHMIRNSADHGIEMPDMRLAAGKPDTGVIRLSAEQAGGNILITVEDDGGGIDRERVLQVARDRGVVESNQQLSDEQIDQLIFAPGFSTAAEVSDISGRGVGMDVVLSNIRRIGGSVHVKSWTGKGTRMTLRLPLTLAVLDVMLVRVAGNPYVIPLSSIVETIQCARANFSRMPTGAQVLQLRGEYVQVVDLASRFGVAGETGAERRFVVLCEADGVKLALMVDDIVGQQQVVIKSLEENFQSIDGIAGGTILGDGNVTLIVDVQGLRSPDSRYKSAA